MKYYPNTVYKPTWEREREIFKEQMDENEMMKLSNECQISKSSGAKEYSRGIKLYKSEFIWDKSEQTYAGAVTYMCDRNQNSIIHLCLVAVCRHGAVLYNGGGGYQYTQGYDALQKLKILKKGIICNKCTFHVSNFVECKPEVKVLFWRKMIPCSFIYLLLWIYCTRFNIRPLNKTLFLHKAAYGRADKRAAKLTRDFLFAALHTERRTHTHKSNNGWNWWQDNMHTIQVQIGVKLFLQLIFEVL